VRVTHWINAIVFLTLVVSGGAILLAHPRLYWGETGAFGSPALIELPLPLNLEQSGWGRSLHFLAAWVCVVNGAGYFLSGLAVRHFRRGMSIYAPSQRMAYLVVVLLLFPSAIATGLAMSPAVSAALPFLPTVLGGYQSSRTIHFVVTNILLLFLAVHIAMVYREGFRKLMRGMLIGHRGAKEVS
jgi:thiosulfate reductase cytochrome b subunit